MPQISHSLILKFNPCTLLILFDDKSIALSGTFETSSKLNAGVLKLFFLFL